MVKVFTIFFESLSTLIWLHLGFKKYIQRSKGKILFIAFYVLCYYLISVCGTNSVLEVIPIVLILMWVNNYFKDTVANTITKFIISLIGVGVSQVVSVVFIFFLGEYKFLINVDKYVSGSVINFLVSVLCYFISKRIEIKLPKPNAYTMMILMYIIGLFVYIKYDYHNNVGLHGELYIAFILLLIVFVIVVLKGQKTHYELEQKRLELDLKDTYEEVYGALLLEMRRKQHDYKNQIAALYSIHLTNERKEELVELQREYGDKLLKLGKYDNIILGCNNPVLSGYVYTKCNEAESKGISVEPNIMCTKSNYNIGIHEVIEILGILINNALEYLINKDWENKFVKIEIYEEKDKLHIDVSNVSEYISYDKIEKMFDVGYSTKGKTRGLGLYSLKSILCKNNGDLIVENAMNSDVNWLNIRVII